MIINSVPCITKNSKIDSVFQPAGVIKNNKHMHIAHCTCNYIIQCTVYNVILPTFSLKGVCDEIFDRYFFHDLNPSGSLISRLKYFRILEFHRDIKIFKKLCSVHPTAVSRKQNTVCLKTLPRASHRRDRLCSVHPSLKSSFATCIIPRILAPLCASYQ